MFLQFLAYTIYQIEIKPVSSFGRRLQNYSLNELVKNNQHFIWQDTKRGNWEIASLIIIPDQELLPDVQFLDDIPVTLNIFLLQIVEQTAAFTYKPHQRAFSNFIVTVNLEVLCKMLNPECKQCNLSFG